MKNNKALIILSFASYLICIPIIYLFGYTEVGNLLVILCVVINVFIFLLNNIKVQYRLMKKKAIIYCDILNSKLIRLYYDDASVVIDKVYECIIDNVMYGVVKRKYTNHFVILLEYRNKNELISLVNRINDDVKKIIEDDMFTLSLKFGIQLCDSDDYETNENKAALACNKAKEEINSYEFYDEDDSVNMIYEKRVLDELFLSLKNNNFEVYYQPKYDYKHKMIIGSEALIRLKRNGKIVPASEFINIAEKYGFTTLIDKYVLKEVCKKIKELKKKKIDFKCISINVSRNTLYEKSMVEYYTNVLKQYGVKKSEIELEVTERDNNYNNKLGSTLHELAENFNVSIDDFGMGSSSLSMLSEKKVKTIKIDRGFIIDESESGRKILSSIIKLALDLGFNLVAEGVETKEQYEYLIKKGCNVIQGYYYSKPLRYHDYELLLKGEMK